MDQNITPESGEVVDQVDFEILGEGLSTDVEEAIRMGLSVGARYVGTPDPLSIFRGVLKTSIRDITEHPRGLLLQRFLSLGPYEGTRPNLRELTEARISDEDVASAISFIHRYVVNSFQAYILQAVYVKLRSWALKSDGGTGLASLVSLSVWWLS